LEYENIIKHSETELNILLFSSISDIKKYAGDVLSEAILRMRNGEIFITEGYDGEYGKIKLFADEEWDEKQKMIIPDNSQKASKRPLLNFDLKAYRLLDKDILYPGTSKNNDGKQLELF
jgi:DNA helicase II / ATP-dependent DNA helicase PcrA